MKPVHYQYCPKCGGHVESIVVDRKRLALCPNAECDKKYIEPDERIASSAIVLDRLRGKNVRALMFRRKRGEGKGKLALSGGFANETDTDATQTALRELKEEAGKKLRDSVRVMGAYGRRTTQLRVGKINYTVHHHGIVMKADPSIPIVLNDEHTEAVWVKLRFIRPRDLAFPHNMEILQVIRERIRRGKPPHLDQ